MATKPIEEILVTGEQPGPALWKVTKGDHVLWLLGEVEPLPKQMVWRADKVQAVIGESQQVLLFGGISVSASGWTGLKLVPRLLTVRKNPDGATLAQLLSADLYARFAALKATYLKGDTSIERLRPTFAADALGDAAIAKLGLVDQGLVERVRRIAHNKEVKVQAVTVDAGDAEALLTAFEHSNSDPCLEHRIAQLETGLGVMRARANAWATGDVELLRKLPYPSDWNACNGSMIGPDKWREIAVRHEAAWFAAIDAALTNNAQTFALAPMWKILTPNGWLNALRARGYAVEEPL